MSLEDLDLERVHQDLAIDEGDIQNSFLNQAQMRNHYGLLAIQARARLDSEKTKLSILEAELDTAIRLKAEQDGEKLTEAKIDARVKVIAAWQKQKDIINMQESEYRILQQTAESFDQRRDMLVQRSKHLLIEREGELRLTASTSHLDNAKEAANNALAASRDAS